MTSSNLGQNMNKSEMTRSRAKKAGAASLAGSIVFGMLAFSGMSSAVAAEPTVPLGTVEGYSVLAGSAVTNTGPSVLGQSVALNPGSAVTGFPPGLVLGTMEIANGPALQAQDDLTTAYNNAAGRSVTAAVAPDLTGSTLTGGVYKPGIGALSLTGALTLDGENDPNTVFIFQSDSTLITGAGSQINLINSAQACNVFWQVGSSATLGTDSSFVGNIMALTSITANTNATLEGRALARNGAVTLDSNLISAPGCDLTVPVVTPTPTPTATTPVVVPTDVPTTPVDVPTTPVDVPTTPVDVPTTPNMTTTVTPPVDVPTTPNMTTTETETSGPWTPYDSSTPLADTGVTNKTPIFGIAGIALLLAGLGFLFSGRNSNNTPARHRLGRQH